jgi:hypothetical protein
MCLYRESILRGSLRYMRPARKGEVKAVPVLLLTEHHAMKAYLWSGIIAPRILDLGTRWR